MDRIFDHKSSHRCRAFEDPAGDAINDRANRCEGPGGYRRLPSLPYRRFPNLRTVRAFPPCAILRALPARKPGCPVREKPCVTPVADCGFGGRAVSVCTLPQPAAASVSQVSKPANLSCVGRSERNLLGEQRSAGPSERERASQSPASKPAGPAKRRAAGIILTRRRFGNLRYGRFGNLRYYRRLGVSLSLTRIGWETCDTMNSERHGSWKPPAIEGRLTGLQRRPASLRSELRKESCQRNETCVY